VVIGFVLALWSIAVCCAVWWTIAVLSMPAFVQRWLFARGTKLPELSDDTPVLLVRPCAGSEPHLSENLQSVPLVGAAQSVRVCVAVAAMTDPAWPIAQNAEKALQRRGFDGEVLLTHAVAPNQKCAQLAAVVEHFSTHAASGAVVIIADSDVDLTQVDLSVAINRVLHGEAACWVVVGEAPGADESTLGDAVSAGILAGSLHSFALVSRIDRGSFVGKLFAIRTDALDSIGGFASLVRYLGEDLELARRLQSRGLAVGCDRRPQAVSTASGRSVTQVRERFARWLLVLRKQRPTLLLSYPLLFLAPWIQCIAATAIACWSPATRTLAAVTVAFALTARASAYLAARRAFNLPVLRVRACIAALLGDLVLAAAWLRALTLTTVRWRERELSFDREGLLQQLPTSP
jgi:ceramide glucosyltransferase